MGYSASNPPIVEATVQEQDNSGFQTQNLELKRLLDDRKKKLSIISPAIADIHKRTEKVEKNQIAGEKEFITKRGKLFPKGSLDHIH